MTTTATNYENQSIKIKIKKEYESLVHSLSEEDYSKLRASIKAHGQYLPIIINQAGIILDGHHRYKVCQELQLEPKFQVKTFDDQYHEKLFVIDSNLERRQLSDFQRTELQLVREPILKKIAKNNQRTGFPTKSRLGRQGVNQAIGERIGVGHDSVRKVKIIIQEAPQELIERVRSGQTSINKAYSQLNMKKKRDKLLEEASYVSFGNKDGYHLILGDFTKKASEIAESSIDLIFSDPSYGEQSLILYKELATVGERVLKPGGSLVVYVPNAYLDVIIDYMKAASLTYWWTIAVKLEGSFPRHYQRQVTIKYKPLLWCVKGNKLNSPEFTGDLIVSDRPDKIGHDWQQSIIDGEHMISRLTVENQIVFDPMFGSCTTGIAALKLGRKFIGIELNPESFKMAELKLGKMATKTTTAGNVSLNSVNRPGTERH
jgi:hypothetical protein